MITFVAYYLWAGIFIGIGSFLYEWLTGMAGTEEADNRIKDLYNVNAFGLEMLLFLVTVLMWPYLVLELIYDCFFAEKD